MKILQTLSVLSISPIILALFLTGCSTETDIYHAKYLDDIQPNSYTNKTYIVKSNFWNRPSCRDLEQWAMKNIAGVGERQIYAFLKYNENITSKNKYLDDEYDAISTDYEICMMNSTKKKCFTCND